MKKIITMALCLMLVLSITACGTNKSETSTNDKSAEDVTDYANIKSDESSVNDGDYYNLTEQGMITVEGEYDGNNLVKSQQSLWTNSTKITVKNNSGTDVVVELYSNESHSTPIMEMQLKDKENKEFTNLSSQYVYSVRVSSESAGHISVDITD